MLLMSAVIKIVLLVVGVSLAILLGLRASKTNGIAMKILKVLGVLVSTIPLIGLIQWIAFRKGSPPYSLSCGQQAEFGVLWYVGIQALGRMA